MKLELKHLAPYLPYALKIKILNHRCDYAGIEFGAIVGYYFVGDILHVRYQGGATGKSQKEFAPILRPMSDADHLIRSEFVKYNTRPPVPFDEEIIEIFCMERLDCENISEIKIEYMQYEAFNWLVKNHFDIFGLIPAGLAIDINTTKKRPNN